MVGFWFAIIFWILTAVGAVLTWKFLPDRLQRSSSYSGNTRGIPLKVIGAAVTLFLAVFGAMTMIGACYDRVDTRNVGIVTQFGRPVGVRTAGIAWHAPWQQISELTEAIQLQSFESINFAGASQGTPTPNASASGPAVQVRLGNGSTAYVNQNLSWRLREGHAPNLFQDYGGSATDVFEKIKQQLVDRQAQVALTKVFAEFNPQTTVDTHGHEVNPNDPNVEVKMVQPNYAKFAEQVKHDLQIAVGEEIEVIDVRIPAMFFDDGTQGRIDTFNQKVQETRNAQQQIQTAKAQELSAEQLAKQPVPDLKIAMAACVNEAVAQHHPNDAAGCWGQIGGNSNTLLELPLGAAGR